jgi:hypothetical protein
VSKPFFTRSTKSKPLKPGEALDVAARYLVYKLYDASRGNAVLWQPVHALGEAAATVSRAVDLGWATVRDEGTGKARQRCAALTEEGRLMARRALR